MASNVTLSPWSTLRHYQTVGARHQPASYNQCMPVLSVTRLRVRSCYLVPFIWLSIVCYRQAKAANGNIGASLLNDPNNTFWTCTVWKTEETMKAFMISGAHRRAMPRLLNWCDEAALVHWVQGNNERPDWYEAHLGLEHEARRSKVSHPSRAVSG